MRKIITAAAVVLILIVLPVGAFLYLRSGFEFQKKNFSELQMLGSITYDSLFLWDPALNATWLAGDVHLIAYFTPGNRIELGETLLQMQQQYEHVGHFQILAIANTPDAMPELATYQVVSANPNFSSIRSRFPQYFGPELLTLVDMKDEIRKTYQWKDPEQMKKLVTHIALLLPKN
ncbi:MAG: hypothetical protein R2806_16360 [Saprospiraceae bacterium]